MTQELSSTGKITIERNGAITKVMFGHPKSNSMPGALLRELAQTLRGVGSAEELRVIGLESHGEGAFCAGASFDEFLAVDSPTAAQEFFRGFAQVISAMREVPVPIVARVQGKAVGGGVGILSAADYCLASENAAVKLSELAIGIGPFIIGPAVERKVGKAQYAAMSLDTDWRSAEWAQQHGLFHQVLSNTTELDQSYDKLLQRLASFSPQALRRMKQVLWEDCADWGNILERRVTLTAELVLTDFAQETVRQLKSQSK